MNALNEVNKVIASVAYYPHRHTPLEEDEWLTPERMAVSVPQIINYKTKFFWIKIIRIKIVFFRNG